MKAILTLIPFLLISCVPSRLIPKDFTIEKNNDEAYFEVDSVTVALKNLEIKGGLYVFGMEVQNKRTKPVFIYPEKIQKIAQHMSYQKGNQDKYLQEVVSVMSPEQVNEFYENKRKSAQSAAVFLFLVGAALSTYDAIKDEEDRSKQYWTKKDQKKSATRDLITSASLLATDVLTDAALASGEKASVELQYLPDELFDRTIIYPGEDYQGKLLFRKFDMLHRYQRIICPLEGNNYVFDFRKATMKERRFLHEQVK